MEPQRKRPQGGAFVLNPRVADAVMQAAFKRFDTPGNTNPERESIERGTRKESELMSLLRASKPFFSARAFPQARLTRI